MRAGKHSQIFSAKPLLVCTVFLILAACNSNTPANNAVPSPTAPPPSAQSSAATGATQDQAGGSLPTLKELEALVNSEKASADMATHDPGGYGWDLFFYTSWPALAKERGVPDPSKKLGQPGTTVWESWKNTSETFLPNGHPPLPWNAAEVIPPPVAKKPFQPSDSGNIWENMTGNSEVDGFPAKDNNDQDILYEIRTDRNAFDYMVKLGLYNIDGQIKYAATKGPLDFAFGAMEIKASWRWLDGEKLEPPCQAQNYFTANAFWAERDKNGKLTGYKTGLMGLTGLHILTKPLKDWVWITLEQVNNESCTKVTRRDPIPANIVALNKKMQALLAGTKWKNYELVGVQVSAGTADNPLLLANTQIETAFQSRSSCLTCHAIASIAKQKPINPADDLRKSFVQRNPPVSPPYYIGPPPPLGSFVSQDFIWSLRRAAWFQK